MTVNFLLAGVVMYKSIMLSNNERTPQVVRQAMLKLGLEGKPEEFSLAQMLPEKGGSYIKINFLKIMSSDNIERIIATMCCVHRIGVASRCKCVLRCQHSP
jgi:hypothetical protein